MCPVFNKRHAAVTSKVGSEDGVEKMKLTILGLMGQRGSLKGSGQPCLSKIILI